ncbi:hypothetical protein [Bacillus sp. FJAT-52991]|uniref:Uncharacterized protein n=1 Tax=Bacillus kandeliae TaxID=3129297 RepID=A0ABZ2NB46_9BACI
MIKFGKSKLYGVLGFILLILLIVILYVKDSENKNLEALQALENSDNSIVFLEKSPNGNGLYLSKEQSTDDQYALLKKRMQREGWVYLNQEGSSLFFEKDNRQLIVETRIWKSNYIEYDVQNNEANIAD